MENEYTDGTFITSHGGRKGSHKVAEKVLFSNKPWDEKTFLEKHFETATTLMYVERDVANKKARAGFVREEILGCREEDLCHLNYRFDLGSIVESKRAKNVLKKLGRERYNSNSEAFKIYDNQNSVESFYGWRETRFMWPGHPDKNIDSVYLTNPGKNKNSRLTITLTRPRVEVEDDKEFFDEQAHQIYENISDSLNAVPKKKPHRSKRLRRGGRYYKPKAKWGNRIWP